MHVGHQGTTDRLLLKDAIKRSNPRRNNGSSPGRLGGPRQGHALAWDHVACLLRYDIRVHTRIGIAHRHVRLLLDPKRCTLLYELLFGRLQFHLLPLCGSFNNCRTGQWVSHRRRRFRNGRHLGLDLHWERGPCWRLQDLAISLRISEWSPKWSIRWRHGLRDRDGLAQRLRSSLCRSRNRGCGSLAEWRLHHGSLRLCSNWDVEAASHGLRNCWRFNLGR